MSDEIEKLKYHISTIKDRVEFNNVSKLAIKLNLDESQFDDLCKLCKEFEHKIENDKIFNFYEFEGEMKDKFGIGYQTIKMIIGDFIDYGYCVGLAYIYTRLVPNKGTQHEQEMKSFIDEVVANSRNMVGK